MYRSLAAPKGVSRLKRGLLIAAFATIFGGIGLPQGGLAQSLVPGGPTVAPVAPDRPADGALVDQPQSLANRPFGARLFDKPSSVTEGGLSPSYRINTGDQVAVNLYGAVASSTTQPVDYQGNIFLPQIGPVPVAGVSAGELSDHLGRQLARTYPADSVKVYGTVVTGHSLGVFVTGFVKLPGRHLGSPTASVIDFLSAAGGIIEASGSYRDIEIKRDGRTVSRFDLYDFLLTGDLPGVEIKEGDTIVVGRQLPTVQISGQARNIAIFEFKGRDGTGYLTGQDLIRLAGPLPDATNVLVSGSRDGHPYSNYLSLARFQTFELEDQDKVEFIADAPKKTLTVRLEGNYLGPTTYVVDKATTLHQLLDQIPVDPQSSNIKAISIRRVSVAQQQRKALTNALDRLQRSVLTAVVNTTGEASLRSAEATMVLQFIDRVKTAVPNGTLVVAGSNGQPLDIPLEEGDTIVIPKVSSTVLVSGEVLAPQTVIWSPVMEASDYIAICGGFSDRADRSRYLIEKQNGTLLLTKDPEVEPGDQITVLPDMDFKTFQFVSDVVAMVFRIAGVARIFD